jgi:hypothetical protein
VERLPLHELPLAICRKTKAKCVHRDINSCGSTTRPKVVALSFGLADVLEMPTTLLPARNVKRFALSHHKLDDAICPKWRVLSGAMNSNLVIGMTTPPSSVPHFGGEDVSAIATTLAHGKSVRLFAMASDLLKSLRDHRTNPHSH